MSNWIKDDAAFSGKRVVVLGLGHFGGGIAACKWLVGKGAGVTVVDQAPADRLAGPLAELHGLPIQFVLGSDTPAVDFQNVDLLVVSPAIPPSHPLLKQAIECQVPVTTEICLFALRCRAKVIGVTGTKGKSTTSTLLARMLETRHRVWLGGNIGRSLLENLPAIEPEHWVVLELSSFMLEHLAAIRWSPAVAVVTMISADHLDWHGSLERYIDAKRNIVRFQKPGDLAVLNRNNPAAWALSADTRATVIEYGSPADRRFDLRLSGEHNQLNAHAAFAAAKQLGISWEQAAEAIADFGGLPHRLQVVARRGGVDYVNDSIATIPEAALAALNAFPAHKVIQIVGGSDKKHLPVDLLCQGLSSRAKAVLCIGETGPAIAAKLKEAGASELIVSNCVDLLTAVRAARSIAVAGDVVLLSPGHPSYDQFVNFQARGEVFERACYES